MIARGALDDVGLDDAVAKYIKAAGKGVLKVMSKMGISTVASYTGAQVFEAVGLGQELVDEYFTGTTSKLGGIGLDEIADEVAVRHRDGLPGPSDRAGPPRARGRRRVPVAPRGRVPPLQPRDRLQAPARHPQRALRRLQGVHRRWSTSSRASLATLRGLFALKEGEREPVPIDEVEPVSEIVKRFSTGAMSYGSISQRGPPDARHRHEPPRRQVEHR